jgi:hypothetical protein
LILRIENYPSAPSWKLEDLSIEADAIRAVPDAGQERGIAAGAIEIRTFDVPSKTP